MERTRRPTHPGAALKAEILPSTGLSISEFAARLNMSRQSLHRILAEEQPVTAATALKLARLLNTSPDLWLNMQRAVDLWDESHRLSEELSKIDPIAA
jgi:addiction module HigA family antidote